MLNIGLHFLDTTTMHRRLLGGGHLCARYIRGRQSVAPMWRPMSTSVDSPCSVEVDVHYHSLLVEDVGITGGNDPLPVWNHSTDHILGNNHAVTRAHVHNFSGMISTGAITGRHGSSSNNNNDNHDHHNKNNNNDHHHHNNNSNKDMYKENEQVIVLFSNMSGDGSLSREAKKGVPIKVSSDHIIPIPPLVGIDNKSEQDRLHYIAALLPSYLAAYVVVAPHFGNSSMREIIRGETVVRVSLCIQNNAMLLQALQDTIDVLSFPFSTKSDRKVEINVIEDTADVSSLSNKRNKAETCDSADNRKSVVRDMLSITNTNSNNMSLHMLRNLAVNGVLVATSDQVVSQNSDQIAMEGKDTINTESVVPGKTSSRVGRRLRDVLDEDVIGIPVASNIFNNLTVTGFSLRAYLASTPLSILREHIHRAVELIDRVNHVPPVGIGLFDEREVPAAMESIAEAQSMQKSAIAVALRAK